VVQIEPVEDASGLPELPGRSEIETFTGGARVGWASASWPLAKLRISRGELVLSIGMLGEYRFKPGDVVAVEQVGVVPMIGRGVRIEHRREDVAERVIFYSWGSPRRILDALERCAFQPSADPHDMPVSRGWPLRIPFVVGAGILWNLLFLIDRPWERASDGEFVWGPGIFAALGLVFLGTQLIRTWTPLQRVALNGPRALERIEGPRKLLAFVSGTMLVLGGIAALLASSSSPSVGSGSAAGKSSEPDAERAAWIQDRRVVDQLEAEGDSLKVPRRVDHWAYFATRYGRDAFEGEARSKGFDVEQKSDTNVLGDASALQFGVQIYRVDSVALEDIHGVVMELSELASTFEGEYDGWETQVVTEGE